MERFLFDRYKPFFLCKCNDAWVAAFRAHGPFFTVLHRGTWTECVKKLKKVGAW